MRFFFVLLAALSFVWAGNAQARDMKEATAMTKKPITIEATGGNPYFNVVFNHKSHARISCRVCHHEEGSEGYYVSCTECHDAAGAHSNDPMSAFQAFHYTDRAGSGTSCLGCHKKLLEQNPEKYAAFRGCRPCHASTSGREQIKLDLTAAQAKAEAEHLESQARAAAAALTAAQIRADSAKAEAETARNKADADAKAAADYKANRAKADLAAAMAKPEPKAAPAETKAGAKAEKAAPAEARTEPKAEKAAPAEARTEPKAEKAAPAENAAKEKTEKTAPAEAKDAKPEQKPVSGNQQMQKDAKKVKAPQHGEAKAQ